MSTHTRLKARLISGERVFGCFSSIPHPTAIEICASQGFDVLCIDAEHSQIDRERLEELIRACNVGNAAAMARVPGAQQEWIASALDAGAEAILVPRVSTVDAARTVVQAGLYPPKGARGLGASRATAFGYNVAGYVADAQTNLLIAVQIETVEGLNCVDAIAAVDGIDMLFVGPFDLAMSLRAAGLTADSDLSNAMARIADTGIRHGKILGTLCLTPQDVERCSGIGYRFFLVGSDAMFLRQSATEFLLSARNAVSAGHA